MCKLHKGLYDLKRTLRDEQLSTAFMELGFSASNSDSSLFVHKYGAPVTFSLVYLDDLIVTGNSHEFIHDLVVHLSTDFALKDLGSLHYFLVYS